VQDFRALLRQHLRSQGLGQGAFARRIGVSPAFVSQVLAGQRNPPLDRMAEWTAALGLSADETEALGLAAATCHGLHLTDLKPGTAAASEVLALPVETQTRIRTLAAFEERRVPDDQLRQILREQIETRQALAIHLKNAMAKAARAAETLDLLRRQIAALASSEHGRDHAPSRHTADVPPPSLNDAIANLDAAEADLDEHRPDLHQQRTTPRRPAAAPRLRP
jgi:transcriptional regulator with XRE-family HTH domain